MQKVTVFVSTLGIISLLVGVLALGTLHDNAVHHTPKPVNMITGSLG